MSVCKYRKDERGAVVSRTFGSEADVPKGEGWEASPAVFGIETHPGATPAPTVDTPVGTPVVDEPPAPAPRAHKATKATKRRAH